MPRQIIHVPSFAREAIETCFDFDSMKRPSAKALLDLYTKKSNEIFIEI